MEGSELTVRTECQGKLLFLFPASEYSVNTNQIHWQVQIRWLDVILENILIVKDRLYQRPL